MKYISTRNSKKSVSAAEAIVEGLSLPDGGLFVPESFPESDAGEIRSFIEMDYPQRAAAVLSKFLPEYTYNKLKEYAEKAYSRFDGDPCPLVKIDDGLYILELFHGPTYAFKDIALTLLPYLLTGGKKLLKKDEETLILVATSGDTGKAALEGFKDVPGTGVMVFYPESGVSAFQKAQMTTTNGSNVKVLGIKGNFDDAQSAVKEIFADKETALQIEKAGYKLSSANSINFGRLVPQIVYYFSSYADLLDAGQIKSGEKVNFCVPSGNFGNILAGYYAKKMGLPINKLICASNKNNVLTDFFSSGDYKIQGREFHKTSSPSMDILISSNLERLIFELSGRDALLTEKRMNELKECGTYSVSGKELIDMKNDFFAAFSGEEEVEETILNFFDEYGYLLDTHTAVAASVLEKYKAESGDESKSIIISTASPYKFASSVLKALKEKPVKDEMKNLDKLEDISAMPVPKELKAVLKKPVLHPEKIDKTNAKKEVIEYCLKKRKK